MIKTTDSLVDGGVIRMKSRHDEIFEAIRREILSGQYDADSNLPSESALAVRFGCSRPTMTK